MRRLAMRLLRLYPRPWRDRYESEVCALLEEHPVRLRTLTDLVAGALRARIEAKEGPVTRQPVDRVRCSFCGKGKDQVRRLIAGPGVYICDRCVELCNEVLAGRGPRRQPPAPSAPPRRPPLDLPAHLRAWVRNLFRSAAPSPG